MISFLQFFFHMIQWESESEIENKMETIHSHTVDIQFTGLHLSLKTTLMQ